MVVRTLAFYYGDAPHEVRAAGDRWYADAYGHAERLARKYSVTVETAAAIIALLSQRQRWQVNLRLAELALSGQRMTGIFAHMRDKVKRIRKGEQPMDVLRGPKIIAFYHAIMGDGDSVVLDTWMLHTMGRDRVTVRQYERFADRLRAEAASVGATPATFQAVVWCQIRGGSL